MKTRRNKTSELSKDITRRDFMGAALMGAGAALLHKPCPAAAQALGPAWTGYGGVGDYRLSNGNTASVVRSAHRIRDGIYDNGLSNVIDTGEVYDLVIVGAGFAGMTASYEFMKNKPSGACLIIDNHAIFGGEAKQNEFDVDGFRITGPQGSNDFIVPKPGDGASYSGDRLSYDYWQELGLPQRFEFGPREGGDPSIAFSKDNYGPMYWGEPSASIGYYFRNAMTARKGVWVKNIWDDNLKRAPWPDGVKRDLIAWRDSKTQYKNDKDEPAWLDSMSYAEFVTRIMGLGPEVLRYADPLLAVGDFGATSDVISAYAASLLGMPGVTRYAGRSPFAGYDTMSFPGGNATLLRHFVKAVFPDAITGPKRFDAIANNAIDFGALDRPGAARRMRLNATVLRVEHEGDSKLAEHVIITYEQDGRQYRVKAKAAVLAIGSWIAKHVVVDLPIDYRAALNDIFHGPILVVNVALRNWRFLDRLGISAARWFDGFAFYANVRHPMKIGDRPIPFHPDKPTVLTFYVPFLNPGLPIAAQGSVGRSTLFGTSYADYEKQIVEQMQRLFSVAGFDARRDIAGIVLNRWGHPLVSPQPGFFFGNDGKPAPRDVIRRRFGRIAFGHSELNGEQSWPAAAAEGKRALTQALEVL